MVPNLGASVTFTSPVSTPRDSCHWQRSAQVVNRSRPASPRNWSHGN